VAEEVAGLKRLNGTKTREDLWQLLMAGKNVFAGCWLVVSVATVSTCFVEKLFSFQV